MKIKVINLFYKCDAFKILNFSILSASETRETPNNIPDILYILGFGSIVTLGYFKVSVKLLKNYALGT